MFDAYLERVGVKNLFNFSITIIVMLLIVIYIITSLLGDAKQSCDNYYKQKVEDFIHAQSSCIYGNERYNASEFGIQYNITSWQVSNNGHKLTVNATLSGGSNAS